MTKPSSQYTNMVGSLDVSMDTLHTLRTLASKKMLAMESGLYHTCGPRFGKSPIMLESWCPPFVSVRSTCGLLLRFCNICGFLNTEIVDCESKSIQLRSISVSFLAWASMCECHTNVVPVFVLPCVPGQSLA